MIVPVAALGIGAAAWLLQQMGESGSQERLAEQPAEQPDEEPADEEISPEVAAARQAEREFAQTRRYPEDERSAKPWVYLEPEEWPDEWPKDWGSQFDDSASDTCADCPIWQEFGARTPEQWQWCWECTQKTIRTLEAGDPRYGGPAERADRLNRFRAELAYIEKRLTELEAPVETPNEDPKEE